MIYLEVSLKNEIKQSYYYDGAIKSRIEEFEEERISKDYYHNGNIMKRYNESHGDGDIIIYNPRGDVIYEEFFRCSNLVRITKMYTHDGKALHCLRIWMGDKFHTELKLSMNNTEYYEIQQSERK